MAFVRQLIFSVVLILFSPLVLSANFDVLISNVDYLDVEAKKIVSGGYIGIKDGKIAYIDKEPPKPSNIDRSIDGSSMVAVPGFIDTHTHLWQHIAKSFFPTGNLQKWVRICRYAHYFTEEGLKVT